MALLPSKLLTLRLADARREARIAAARGVPFGWAHYVSCRLQCETCKAQIDTLEVALPLTELTLRLADAQRVARNAGGRGGMLG